MTCLTPALRSPGFAVLLAALAGLLPAHGSTPVDPAFAVALADLKQSRLAEGGVSSVELRVRNNEAFFTRFDPASLGPREVAEIVRLNAFAYGDAVKATAKLLVERLEPLAAAPTEDGALAALLLVPLSGPAGRGPQRAGWEAAALRHPAFDRALRGDNGDLALDVACRTAPRTTESQALLLGLADQLDARKSVSAARAILTYWDRLVAFVPEGERRQAVRQRLVDYLTAAQTRLSANPDLVEWRASIDRGLVKLNGAEARGLLVGRIAPPLHFLWSSRPGWTSLDDLRGKVVVLDFWATWCAPCVAAFPEMAKLVERYRGRAVEIVGVTSLQGHVMGLGPKAIDCRQDPQRELNLMGEFMEAKHITWPVVFSREPVMNPDYGVDGIPTTIVIAPDGSVRHKAVGYSGDRLAAQVDAVLQEFNLDGPAATP